MLNAKEYMKFVLLEVENLVVGVSKVTEIGPLVEMFELYHHLLEFYTDIIEPIKPKGPGANEWEAAKSLFDVEQMFRPVVKRWFAVTETQLIKWIDRAIELDKVSSLSLKKKIFFLNLFIRLFSFL